MALKENYTVKDYWPLIVIFVAGLSAAFVGFNLTGEIMRAMTLFMGTVLLLLSALKVYNRSEFAMAFATYDVLAGWSDVYARNYPFLELLLAVGYLLGVVLPLVSAVTFIVMTIGAVGVARKMNDDEVIQCACLGAVFSVPMTWVTLVEDLLMAAMAGYMLILLI